MSKTFIAKMIIAAAKASTGGAAYGLGYATETVKDEVKYYADKVRGTAAADHMISKYHEGQNDAQAAFNNRVEKREEKATQRRTEKAINEMTKDMGKDLEGLI